MPSNNRPRRATTLANEEQLEQARRHLREMRGEANASPVVIEAEPANFSSYSISYAPSRDMELDWSSVSTSTSEPAMTMDWDDDDDIEPEPMERVVSGDFPAHQLPVWSLAEREAVVTQWFRQMEYRIKWIFYREEREGVSRTRMTHAFNPDDFKTRAAKTGRPHPLDNETSKFYDWNIGGSDFIIRLESFQIKNRPVLRLHFIYRPLDKEVCYEDRVWDGDSYYRECNQVWANTN